MFKIDYKSIPELLDFANENPKHMEFLERNKLEYRCIKDADNTLQPAYYVFFGFETYHDLYEQGCWGAVNATDLLIRKRGNDDERKNNKKKLFSSK